MSTFVSTFSQHLLRADVEAVWHPLCLSVFSTFLLISKCWSCSTRHSPNISQHESTNVERMLRSFDRGFKPQDLHNIYFVLEMLRGCKGHLTGHGLNISKHSLDMTHQMLRECWDKVETVWSGLKPVNSPGKSQTTPTSTWWRNKIMNAKSNYVYKKTFWKLKRTWTDVYLSVTNRKNQ